MQNPVSSPANYTVAAFAGTPVAVATKADVTISGLICTVANTGGITIYDNTAASGTVLYTVASLTAGQVVPFPKDIICKTGITVALTTDGTVNVLTN